MRESVFQSTAVGAQHASQRCVGSLVWIGRHHIDGGDSVGCARRQIRVLVVQTRDDLEAAESGCRVGNRCACGVKATDVAGWVGIVAGLLASRQVVSVRFLSGVHHVPLNMAVIVISQGAFAAASNQRSTGAVGAARRTTVSSDLISVVALLARCNDPIATTSHSTVRVAAIPVHLVAVVAFLPWVNDTVPAGVAAGPHGRKKTDTPVGSRSIRKRHACEGLPIGREGSIECLRYALARYWAEERLRQCEGSGIRIDGAGKATGWAHDYRVTSLRDRPDLIEGKTEGGIGQLNVPVTRQIHVCMCSVCGHADRNDGGDEQSPPEGRESVCAEPTPRKRYFPDGQHTSLLWDSNSPLREVGASIFSLPRCTSFPGDARSYPTTQYGFEALVPEKRGPVECGKYSADGYLDKVPIDPWRNRYAYIFHRPSASPSHRAGHRVSRTNKGTLVAASQKAGLATLTMSGADRPLSSSTVDFHLHRHDVHRVRL